nr:DNA repair protein REV1-like [Procambarus clarkii]
MRENLEAYQTFHNEGVLAKCHQVHVARNYEHVWAVEAIMGRGDRGRRGRRRGYGSTGFEEAGGYMAVKIAKLQNQYKTSVTTTVGEDNQGVFKGVAIFVNGYTEPTAEELKRIMMTNGGTYHHYYSRSNTTHIIASNLPDTKIKNLNTSKIVSPKWITESLEAGHLLDYTKYILYTHQSTSQPKLSFKPSSLTKGKDDSSIGNLVTVRSSVENTLAGNGAVCREISKETSLVEPVHLDTVLSSSKTNSCLTTQNMSSDERHKHSSMTALHISSPTKDHSMSTANPGFLSEFYNNSRLHHISTMGAMFKQYINELQSKEEGFPGRRNLIEWIKNKSGENNLSSVYSAEDFTTGKNSVSVIKKRKRTIMHIDMDCFFVSVGLRKHPELRGKPLAVTHARGNQRSHGREGMDRQYEFNYYKDRAKKRLQRKMQPMAAAKSGKFDGEFEYFDDENNEVNPSTGSVVVPASNTKFSTVTSIDDTSSLSEIASCSYEARKAGVKNGMFLGPALKLCPDLQTIPYDFDGYKEVSFKLYDIVASFTHDIEAVSCDEMYVDLTELLQTCQVTPEDFATYLRDKVQADTGCPCSAGMGPNMLVARMATRLAKPNGQHLADPDDLPYYMKDQKVSGLPGVGWSLESRLQSEGIQTCGDLQAKTLGHLQAAFGARTGLSLFNYCRGIDDRPVKSEHVRKSVSAEVNYGIRFTCQSDADKFIRELAAEVENRLNAIKLKGKCITLKLKIRAKDAPVETAKFMGHGVCDNITKSVSVASATSTAAVIEREALSLLHQVKVPPQDFRGVGIQVSRLEGHQGQSGGSGSCGGSSIKSFLLAGKNCIKKKAINPNTNPLNSLETNQSPSLEENGLSHINMNTNNNVCSVAQSSMFQFTKEKCYSKNGTAQPGPSMDQPAPASSTSKSVSAQKNNIDLEVLMALPDDMREQVIAEYRQQGYIIPSVGDSVEHKPEVMDGEPKPSTSGYVAPVKKSGKRESETSTHGYAKMSTNQGKGTSKLNIGKLNGGNDFEISKESEGSTKQGNKNFNGTVSSDNTIARERAGENTDGKSNSSTVSEDAQNEALITSFSQVDTSFLEAIPEDLREELRQDFEHKKQAGAMASLSPNKQRPQRTGPAGDGGSLGKRESRDPHQAGAGGLMTLMHPGSRQQPAHAHTASHSGNSSTRKVPLAPGKKRNKLSKAKMPGVNTSPRKRYPLLRTSGSQLTPENTNVNEESVASSTLSTLGEGNSKETRVDADKDIPNLCGVEEMSEVKSLIREWVSSCSHPEEEDAEILACFYTSLISHHDLEKLDVLMKYLYRQVLRRQNEFWESAYRTVVGIVQGAMLEHHDVKLKVLHL